jgi:hypothetical protein
MAPVAIPSHELPYLRTAHEYGLSAAQIPLAVGKSMLKCGLGEKRPIAPENVHNGSFFWLTLLRGEAYIPPLGAPSAYGAIARL